MKKAAVPLFSLERFDVWVCHSKAYGCSYSKVVATCSPPSRGTYVGVRRRTGSGTVHVQPQCSVDQPDSYSVRAQERSSNSIDLDKTTLKRRQVLGERRSDPHAS